MFELEPWSESLTWSVLEVLGRKGEGENLIICFLFLPSFCGPHTEHSHQGQRSQTVEATIAMTCVDPRGVLTRIIVHSCLKGKFNKGLVTIAYDAAWTKKGRRTKCCVSRYETYIMYNFGFWGWDKSNVENFPKFQQTLLLPSSGWTYNGWALLEVGYSSAATVNTIECNLLSTRFACYEIWEDNIKMDVK
jgi:hypothetical protein